MTYAAIASLSQTIHLILNYHQHLISPQFKNQIISVYEHIIFLQSFLEDFPNEANDLERRMREATNVAEDIIELLLSDSLLESTVVSPCNLDELERVTEEIESIAKAVKERHREAVGGFNDDLMEIVSRLCTGSSGLEIIPIVGTGGIGKTTLARNAYDNPLSVEHFDIRAWVTISLDYSRRGTIFNLLGSMHKYNAENISNNSEDELIESVYQVLFGRRYLIVLDDVWSQEVWDTLELPDNRNGSRIILTTRLPDVARGVASHGRVHEMCLMNVDQSWNLLRHKIFKGDPCPPKLEYIGKMIARSCRGLPLAVEVVSGILTVDQTLAAWEDIVENVKIAIDCEDNEQLLQILHLSYIYLPQHLRPCFLYLGIFRDDQEIHVSRLIKLWVAEGFLNESGCKSFEETGEEYLEDLVERSLVSVRKRKSNGGRIKSFSIHGLMRDMCVRQAYADNFFLHVRRLPLPADAMKLQRRVSIFNYNDDSLEIVDGSTNRTIICFEGNQEGIQRWLGYFTLLRILGLSNSFDAFDKYDLPDQLFQLFHLRYLAFGYPFSIPKAISNLENLQTWIIRPSKYFRELVELPVEIWRMRQLRHVVVHSCVLPSQEEEEESMSALENLQTLTEAVDFICSKETLRMIPNLKKLCILYVDSRDSEDYELHNLIHLQKLEILKIETHVALKQLRISSAFHPTVRKLSLSGVGVPWEDMNIVGSLPNLRVLKLRNHACVGDTWETKEGGFSQLKFLLIGKSELEHWITESSHFPRLKCVVFHHCRRLREVPDDVGEIPTLELIEVDDCNKSLLNSIKRIKENQLSLGNDSLQVLLFRYSDIY